MRKSLILWPLSLALVAGGAYWAGASKEPQARGGQHSQQAAAAPASNTAASASAAPSVAPARIEGDWKAAYGCRPPCSGGSEVRQQEHGIAFTLEEAEWLKRNGFPSAFEVDALRKLDEKQVLARANAGDSIATVVAAQSIINQDGPIDLITPALSREATKGSVAALVLLGAANARKADAARRAGKEDEWVTHRDLAVSDYLRAYMRGDYLASRHIAQLTPSGITPDQLDMAYRMMAIEGKLYSDRTGRKLAFDPRPPRPIDKRTAG